jgi:hypothetical protein
MMVSHGKEFQIARAPAEWVDVPGGSFLKTN